MSEKLTYPTLEELFERHKTVFMSQEQLRKYKEIQKGTSPEEELLEPPLQLGMVKKFLRTENGLHITQCLLLLDRAEQHIEKIAQEIEAEGFKLHSRFDQERKRKVWIIHKPGEKFTLLDARPENIAEQLQAHPKDRRALNQQRFNEASDFLYQRRYELRPIIKFYIHAIYLDYVTHSKNGENATSISDFTYPEFFDRAILEEPVDKFAFLHNAEDRALILDFWNSFFDGQFPQEDEKIIETLEAIENVMDFVTKLQPEWARAVGFNKMPEPWRSVKAMEHFHEITLESFPISEFLLNQKRQRFSLDTLDWLLFLRSRLQEYAFFSPEMFNNISQHICDLHDNEDIDQLLQRFLGSVDSPREIIGADGNPIEGKFLDRFPSRPFQNKPEIQKAYRQQYHHLIAWGYHQLPERTSKPLTEGDIKQFLKCLAPDLSVSPEIILERTQAITSEAEFHWQEKHILFLIIMVAYLQRGASLTGLKGKVFENSCQDLWQELQYFDLQELRFTFPHSPQQSES